MSLVVWLPLNGNLNNLGLTNISITNNGTTINNNGKIGKAIEFGANKYIKLDNYASTFLTYNTWSLSLWFKCTAQNTSHSGSALISGGNWNLAANLLNLGLCNFSSDHYTKLIISGSGGWANGYSYNFYLNTWYHIVLTSGNGAMRAYVNGILIGDSYAAFKPTTLEQTWICIGNGTYSLVFHFYGLMNDVRIYDHALSSKEIEEISKGLVLHYKLDNNGMGLENLIPNSSSVWTAVNSKANFSQVAASTSNFGLADGDTYIFSIEVKIPTEIKKARARVLFYNSGSDRTGPIGTTFVTNGEGRIYVTGTILSGYALMQLAIDWNASSDITTTNVVCYYRNIKLEKGNKMTIWSPALSDANYPNNFKTIIYDCSGYGNDGTVIGSLTAATGSPRYEVGTIFNGTDAAIKVINNNWCSLGMEALTINLWVKASAWSGNIRLFSCTESGGFNTESGNSGYLRFPVNVYTNAEKTTSAYKYDGNELQRSALPVNEWIMLTFVYDTTGTKTYINGELHHTYSNTSYGIHFNTNARLFLGCEANTANPSTPYLDGQESDFRIYATALSAAAIKELYDTSGSIDSQGNIYARELVE